VIEVGGTMLPANRAQRGRDVTLQAPVEGWPASGGPAAVGACFTLVERRGLPAALVLASDHPGSWNAPTPHGVSPGL
jgi:hypothetical protein